MLAGETEVQARVVEIGEMLRQICVAEEFPWFVSDEATVLDVCSLDREEIAARLAAHYGRKIELMELQLPIWKLVGRLTC